MALTRLVLVRHGQSRATVDQIVGGETGCTGLTETGVEQVNALADRLVRTKELDGATELFASTLPRAIETAELLSGALGGLAVVTDRDLCELDPGEGDGFTWEEFRQRYGGFHMADEPYRRLAPGGESWAEFQLRVGRTLTRLVSERPGGLIVAACHGGIVEGSLRTFLGVGTNDVLETPANASLTEWACQVTPGAALRWRLIRYNDAAHVG